MISTPTYSSDDALLYTGDCLALLKSMPNDFVDLVMCSPPYEAARIRGIYTRREYIRSQHDGLVWSIYERTRNTN